MQFRFQHGQVLVEMAFVLLLFLLMVFGITEFARAMYTYNTIVQSTRAAARWAVVNVSSDGDTTNKDKAKNIAVYGDPNSSSGDPLLPGLSTSLVEVQVLPIEVDSNGIAISQKVLVRIVGYRFNFIVPIMPDITIPPFETSLYTESMGATS